MNIIKESFLWSILMGIYSLSRESRIILLGNRLSSLIKRLWFDSYISTMLSRQGRLATDWERSRAHGTLYWLVNLVPRLLNRLYSACRELWEGSILMRAVWYCGENAYIFISWFFLFIFVVPYDYWNNMYSFAGMLLILAIFYVHGMGKDNIRLELKSIGVYAVAFFAFEALFVFLSIDKSTSLRYFTYHFSCLLTILIIVSSIRSVKQLIRIIDFSLVGTAVASMYALIQRMQGLEVNKSFVDLSVNANMPGRVFSFFLNPNSFAMLLVMMLPLSAALIFYTKGYKRFFYAFVFLIASVALLMTYTRAAWGGYALSIIVLAMIMKPVLVPIFMLAGVFALPLLPDTIFNRVMTIFNTEDSSISSRKPLYSAVWRHIGRHPVIGAGLGAEVVRTSVLSEGLYTGTTPFVHAHSLYLQITAELGIFGLLAFLGAMASGIKNGLKAIFGKRASKLLQAIIAAQISAFAGILLCSFVDYPWSFPRVMLIFWFAFAVLISAIKLANQGESE